MEKPRLNLLDEHARKLAGMGPEWSPYRYEAIEGPDFPSLLTGALAALIRRARPEDAEIVVREIVALQVAYLESAEAAL